MIGGQAAEFLAADRAERRGGVGFGLSAALHGLSEQVLHILSGLGFQMAKILIATGREPLQGIFQRTRCVRRQHSERFG